MGISVEGAWVPSQPAYLTPVAHLSHTHLAPIAHLSDAYRTPI